MPRQISDYVLHIKGGPDAEHLKPLHVNHESFPLVIDSPYFRGQLLFRMKDYHGAAPPSETGLERLELPLSNYFQSRQRLYAISFQGQFLKEVRGDDLRFGLELSLPVKLPMGSSLGLKIAKWLEPSLEYDLECSRPQMYAPFMTTMNAIGVYEEEAFRKAFLNGSTETPLPWAFAHCELPEDTRYLKTPFSTPLERKKYFGRKEHRSQVEIPAGSIVTGEFYDAHFDFGQYAVKLPGLSLPVFKSVWDGHVIQFSLRSSECVYFVVVVELLPRTP